MPYDINNPPKKLRGLSDNKQRQWLHVYSSCMDKHGDDIRCQKSAWSVTGGWQDKSIDECLAEMIVSSKLDMQVELKEPMDLPSEDDD